MTDITEQIGQSAKTIHELEKAAKQAEQERRDTQAALEEVEVCLIHTQTSFREKLQIKLMISISLVFPGTRGSQNPAPSTGAEPNQVRGGQESGRER